MRRCLAALALLLAAQPALAGAWDDTSCNGGDGWQDSVGDALDAACLDGLDAAVDDNDSRLDAIQGLDFLVGTATGSLSGEIAVGATPGGELGGTWAAPTIDDGISVNFADGSIEAADLAAGIARDTEATLHCVTKQVFAPDGTEPPVDMIGLPFAVTLTRYRCNVLPAALGETITATLQECAAGHTACANSDAAALTCDDNGTAWDTTITDAAIDADDQVAFVLGTPSGSMATGSVTLDLCYSRQVVQ